MGTIECTGKTLAEAKQQASVELKTELSYVAYEILEEEPDRGFMHGYVTIKAWVDETLPVITEPDNQNLVNEQTVSNTDGETASNSVSDKDTIEKVVLKVQQIMDMSGLRVTAKHQATNGKYLEIELLGRDASLIVDKRGEALDGLQFLVNLIASKKIDPNVRIVLDAYNYRRRRAEILKNLAVSLAVQVKERQEEAELDPLPAHDRRIIHQVLLSDMNVTTYSEGDEPRRYVVISPKKKEQV